VKICEIGVKAAAAGLGIYKAKAEIRGLSPKIDEALKKLVDTASGKEDKGLPGAPAGGGWI
jgi:hypothetical protein